MASYKKAVAWIALNDEPLWVDLEDLEAISEMISVQLIAELFGKPEKKVAQDVLKYRITYGDTQEKAADPMKSRF